MSQKWMCVNMGMFVNPDNLAFQAALNARIYVDKSGILNYTNSVLGSTDAFICNSRPRRFGKSVTANMLTAYYSKGCDSISKPSYICIESADTISPPNFSAQDIESAVFPEAVGPTITNILILSITGFSRIAYLIHTLSFQQ